MKIEAYEFGEIVIGGDIYSSDVIILPGAVKDSWWRKAGHSLHVEDLAEMVAAQPAVLVVGTGYFGRMSIPKETRTYLESIGIELVEERTGKAVKRFNELAKTDARVVAAWR